MIECGLPMKALREKLSFSLSGLAGCLISHAHGDHSKAAHDMLKAGVELWTSEETAEALGISNHHRTNILRADNQEHIGEWVVLPFDLHHDVPTHGFLIGDKRLEKLLFIPDTSYIRNRFESVNIIAIECNYLADKLSYNIQHGSIPKAVGRRVRRNHMELNTVKNFLLANDLSMCREIHLLHLSNGNSDEKLMVSEIQQITGVPVYAES
jgi:phosphoribosyl 1,2-cyclic phosphodiesterase